MSDVAREIASELLLVAKLLGHRIEALLQQGDLACPADFHATFKIALTHVAHRPIQLAQRIEDTARGNPGEHDGDDRGDCGYLKDALVQCAEEGCRARRLLRQRQDEEVQGSGASVGKTQRRTGPSNRQPHLPDGEIRSHIRIDEDAIRRAFEIEPGNTLAQSIESGQKTIGAGGIHERDLVFIEQACALRSGTWPTTAPCQGVSDRLNMRRTHRSCCRRLEHARPGQLGSRPLPYGERGGSHGANRQHADDHRETRFNPVAHREKPVCSPCRVP